MTHLKTETDKGLEIKKIVDHSIEIKGARANNLKNISISIPKNKLIVVTGVSGSGKSSLTMDILFAEGQRRYVESLSSYARQFLGRMKKPEVDSIKGICPAIAIQQKVSVSNARSTVGTLTEIYDYIRLLFARIGKTYSPISNELVKKHEVSDVVDFILSIPQGSPVQVFIPLPYKYGERSLAQELDLLLQKGFTRILNEDVLTDIQDFIASEDPMLGSKILDLTSKINALNAKPELNAEEITRLSAERDNYKLIVQDILEGNQAERYFGEAAWYLSKPISSDFVGTVEFCS
jgi:excinuclease ABC subunit A